MRPDLSVNGEDEGFEGGPDEEPGGSFVDAGEGPKSPVGRSIHGSSAGEIEAILSRHAPEPPQAARAGATGASTAPDLGPCLYFGPAGQRCDRRAVHDGFCARHQPSAGPGSGSPASQTSLPRPDSVANRKKVMAAAIAIIGILLPYLVDLLRELARLLPR